MQSIRSIDYFRDTLNATLNYFGRKQKKTKKIISNKCTIENNDDDLIEIVEDDNENEAPTIEKSNLLHNSYKLFYKRLPPTVARDVNIKQGRVRDYYRQTFDNRKNILPKGIIQLNSSINKFENFDDNDIIQEALQHDLENNFQINDENDDDLNENHAHLLEILGSNDEDEEQIPQKETAKLVFLFFS
jgi:hypothetical protein